jgi:hypothetical protein
MGELADAGVELDRTFLWEKLEAQFPGITLDQIDEPGALMARNISIWFHQRGFPVREPHARWRHRSTAWMRPGAYCRSKCGGIFHDIVERRGPKPSDNDNQEPPG